MLKVVIVVGVAAALCAHFDVGTKVRTVFGQYHYQQARQLARRGDLAGALSQADQAVSWNPDLVPYRLLRAHIRKLNRDYAGALVDVEDVLAINPPEPQYHDDALSLQIDLFHYLHRHRDAADAATEMLRRNLGNRAENLNTRAYARAVDETSDPAELKQALIDVDEALEELPDNASFLDTRGYVLYKLGRHNEALEDMNRAIELVMAERDEFEIAIRGRRLTGEQAALKAREQERFNGNLAVMHHHRGEIHEKLGDAEQARKDLIISKQMGFDPAAGVY
jgi:tetratricopeptide (TPR) repeat protein